MSRMRNKKANLDIVIFTIMVLVICTYALVKIASYREKFEYRIKGYNIVEDFQLEKKDLDYRLKKYLEECTTTFYFYVTKNKGFYEEKEVEGGLFFDKIKENVNQNFLNGVKNCLRITARGENKNFLEENKYPYKKLLLKKLEEENFNLTVDEQDIKIEIKEIQFTSLDVTKKDNLTAKISFKKIGLLPFEDINKTLQCKKDNNCIEEITKNLFKVKLEEKKETKNNKEISYLVYNFTSRREFYIQDEFKKINFEIKVLEKIEENTN